MSKNEELSQCQSYHKQHPTDFIHGLLSSHVYTNSEEGDTVRFPVDTNSSGHQYDEFLKNWLVRKIYNKPESNNYYSVLYVNDKTKQAVLSHRGTDIIASLKGQHGSLKADFTEILNGEIDLQQAEAHTSTKDAIDIVKNNYNFSLTGHSLGAWLAELSLYFCHRDFGYDVSAGYIKAVTFDSPGTQNQMQRYKSSIKNHDTKIIISELNIVTYLSAPNLVNVCNKHVGKVYRLFPEIPPQSKALKLVEKLPRFISNNRVYLDALLAISGHNLDCMLATFDSSTGKPKIQKYREVLDWPSIKYKPSQSSAPSAAVSKLMVSTTYGSLAKVITEFLSGNLQLKQLFETYSGLDITTNKLGYQVKGNQTGREDFFLKYKGHYRIDHNEVNPKIASISQVKGTTKWYLIKLHKCSNEYIKSKLSEPAISQLLTLKKQYEIILPNNKGKREIRSEFTDVENLEDQMSSLFKNNAAIKKVLGNVEPKTDVEQTISLMKKEAAEWVKTCSANNVIKEKGESNRTFVNKIEKLANLLSQDGINMLNDISAKHLLNSLYSMQALANFYMYNKHNGERAREILISAKKLAEQCVLNMSGVSFNFDTLTKEETYTELIDTIPDLPEMYTGIIYLLARTYMYQGDKTDAIQYFELSKYLGHKLKMFEGYLSERSGLGVIKREEIERDIANRDYEQATKKLNESVQLYQKLKSDNTKYKEGYKPGEGQYEKYNKIIPTKDVYNQIECSEQLVKCYMSFIIFADDKAKHSEYVHEIFNQFIGSDELPGMLKQLKGVLSKKENNIYNSLGKILLKLYDQQIDFQELKDAVNKELQLTTEANLTERDDLSVIRQIFTLSKTKSKQGEFTRADAHDGLRMVCERQLKQGVLEERQKEDLIRSISEHTIARDKINQALKRNVKYENHIEFNTNTTTAGTVPASSTSLLVNLAQNTQDIQV